MKLKARPASARPPVARPRASKAAASVKNTRSPTSGSRASKKESGHRARQTVGLCHKELVVSSEVAYHDLDERHSNERYREINKEVVSGKSLVFPYYDAEGFKVCEAVSKVLDVAEHRNGLMVEVQFVASDKRAPQELTQLKEDGDVLLHLCKSTSSCKAMTSKQNLIHLREWKCVDPEQLDESWIKPGQC